MGPAGKELSKDTIERLLWSINYYCGRQYQENHEQ